MLLMFLSALESDRDRRAFVQLYERHHRRMEMAAEHELHTDAFCADRR